MARRVLLRDVQHTQVISAFMILDELSPYLRIHCFNIDPTLYVKVVLGAHCGHFHPLLSRLVHTDVLDWSPRSASFSGTNMSISTPKSEAERGSGGGRSSIYLISTSSTFYDISAIYSGSARPVQFLDQFRGKYHPKSQEHSHLPRLSHTTRGVITKRDYN